MVQDDRIKQNEQIAGFRYALIAELTNRNLSESEIKHLIKEKAKRTYEIPFSTKKKVTAKSIRKWLKVFQTHGVFTYNFCQVLRGTNGVHFIPRNRLKILKKFSWHGDKRKDIT